MSEYAKARGTLSPKRAVAGTGVILLLGGVSMLLGAYPVVGIILLIVYLVVVSFQMHSFWKLDDVQMKQIDMINFTKNMALVGTSLMLAPTASVADESGDRIGVTPPRREAILKMTPLNPRCKPCARLVPGQNQSAYV